MAFWDETLNTSNRLSDRWIDINSGLIKWGERKEQARERERERERMREGVRS